MAKVTTAQVQKALGISGNNLGIGNLSQADRQAVISGTYTGSGLKGAAATAYKPTTTTTASTEPKIFGNAGASNTTTGLPVTGKTKAGNMQTEVGANKVNTGASTTGAGTSYSASTTAAATPATTAKTNGLLTPISSNNQFKKAINATGSGYGFGSLSNADRNAIYNKTYDIKAGMPAGLTAKGQQFLTDWYGVDGSTDTTTSTEETGAKETPTIADLLNGMSAEEKAAWMKENGFVGQDSLDALTGQIQSLQDALNAKDEQETTTTQGANDNAYDPILNSQVNYGTETVEGRLGSLLAVDKYGKFTNPAIQQAAEAAQAIFAQRGLLNSSSANQAALEAAIAKATEIASQDAQTVYDNRRSNVTAANSFAQGELNNQYAKEILNLQQSYESQSLDKERAYNLQNNYISSIRQIDGDYQRMVAQLQATDMEPAAKQKAMDEVAILRDNSIRMTSIAFESMPSWEDEWSQLVTVALPTHQFSEPAANLMDLTGLKQASTVDLMNAIGYGSAYEDKVPEATYNAWVTERRSRG